MSLASLRSESRSEKEGRNSLCPGGKEDEREIF